MATYFLYFSLFYCLLSVCIVCPPTEFVSAGLTVPCIFGKWLGNENNDFIQYHIKRTATTVLVHSLIPLGYLLGLTFFANFNVILLLESGSIFWILYAIFSIITPTWAIWTILRWRINQWSGHPIAKSIKSLYRMENPDAEDVNWQNVAFRINMEYKSIDKVTINLNSLIKVVIINNWIIKITPRRLHIAHQNQSVLVVLRSDTHAMSPVTTDVVQYIDIKVSYIGQISGGEDFNIRLDALHFQELQNKVSSPIVILQNVVFHRTLLDRFIDTFKEHIGQNTPYETSEDTEQCIGCMQVEANVKLNKQCEDDAIADNHDRRLILCKPCHCRPLWCSDCMAKWFASRQDKGAPETWLSSKCSCPVCRATFCILDVCSVRKVNVSDS